MHGELLKVCNELRKLRTGPLVCGTSGGWRSCSVMERSWEWCGEADSVQERGEGGRRSRSGNFRAPPHSHKCGVFRTGSVPDARRNLARYFLASSTHILIRSHVDVIHPFCSSGLSLCPKHAQLLTVLVGL